MRKGVSAIIVNDKKGEELLDIAAVTLAPCKLEQIYDRNRWMIENYEKPLEQNSFIYNYVSLDEDAFFRKYTLKYKVTDKIRRAVRRFFK